jgi:F-type H+-transporting ATPase subunit b
MKKLELGLRHLLLAFCLAVPLLGLPAAAQAAEPEHGGSEHGGAHHEPFNPKTFAFQLLNFALLVGVLGYFGGRAINRALANRHEQMKKDLDEAVQARAAAEARLKAHERRLANLEKEVTALRTSIKEEALAEEKRLLEAAEEKSRRIQDETRFLMDQEVKQAEIRFRTEIAAEAVQIAEQVVRQAVMPEDDARLGKSFIADLESGGKVVTASSGSGQGGNQGNNDGKKRSELDGTGEEAIS